MVSDPSKTCEVLLALKDIKMLHYRRIGAMGEIAIEQTLDDVVCENCKSKAYVKDRRFVNYVDLPFDGTPITAHWKNTE